MWELVYEGAGKIGGLAASQSAIVASDTGRDALGVLGLNGPMFWREKAGGAEAIAAAPDGKIIAAQPRKNRIVSFDNAQNRRETVRVKSITASALTVSGDGTLYALDTREGRLYRINAKNTVTTLDADLPGGGRGMVLSPDQTRLFVLPIVPQNTVFTYELQGNGKALRKNFASFRCAPGSVCGIAVDFKNRLFVAVQAGIVICDETERTINIIAPPTKNAPVAHIVFLGEHKSVLFAASGNQVFRLRL